MSALERGKSPVIDGDFHQLMVNLPVFHFQITKIPFLLRCSFCSVLQTKVFRNVRKKLDTLWEYIHAHPKKILFWVAVVYFIFWILFDDFGLVKRIRMEADHIMLLERQKVEQKKIIDNELRIQHARDPDSIEKAARERYNFRKPGETLFIIREK